MRRVESRSQQMKEVMAKQKIDDARGAAYGAGVTIEMDAFQTLATIKEMERKQIG